MKIFYVSLIILSKKFYNKPEVDPIEFLTILELVNMFLYSNVNEGFSVVKKNEMKFYK
jgi:hypothetical protein